MQITLNIVLEAFEKVPTKRSVTKALVAAIRDSYVAPINYNSNRTDIDVTNSCSIVYVSAPK